MTCQSYWHCLLPLLLCVAISGYGQQEPASSAKGKVRGSVDSLRSELQKELKEAVSEIKALRPDSGKIINVDNTALSELPQVDSVGFSYENGNLVLPRYDLPSISEEELNAIGEDKVLSMPDTDALKQAVNGYKHKVPAKETLKGLTHKDEKYGRELRERADSVRRLAQKGEDFVSQVRDGIADPEKIYSNQTLKKLYDSLGISKLDSVLALASSKKEVSKEELLDAINLSFPSSPISKEVSGPKDLLEAPEVKSVRNEVSIPDLSSLKISPDQLGELPPIGSFQLPTDSIPMLDSLRTLFQLKEKVRLREKDLRQNMKSAIVKRKDSFRDKIYLEGILSILKNDQEINLLQVSPAVGFRIKGNFSTGLGPNIRIARESQEWKFGMGYRAFAKHEILSQKAYVQVEDFVEPHTINREYTYRAMHKILAGGGYLWPISRSLAINFCVLYSLNQNDDSQETASPWLVRIGLSSRRKKL